MRPLRLFLGVLLVAAVARADTPRSPLRLVPDQSEFVFQVHHPRKLLGTVLTLDLVEKLQKFEAAKEALDSTQVRRFFQLLAYFEKRLEVKTPDFLERVAGGGIVIAAKLGDKAPALFVAQGSDESLSRKFLTTALEVIEQELARQDAKGKVVKAMYQGVETLSLGKDLHVALFEGAILVSNSDEVLKRSLDLGKKKDGKSLATHAGLTESAKLLPKDRLASFWLNMEPVRRQPDFEPIYKTPRDPFITIVFGGWANLLGRTPYLCGSLSLDTSGAFLTFRVPCGTEGMGTDRAINAPPHDGPCSRSLLQPKGTLFSSSYHWDLARFWTDRLAIFGKERVMDIETFDKQSGTILSSLSFSKLLTATGPYQRVVAAHQAKSGYKRQPKSLIPSFAFVQELRKPEEFRKGIETGLRTGGLLLTAQYGLKSFEEKHQGYEIIGYRFDEQKELIEDPEDARYNFSPCFVLVGNQYVFCSTVELCRELVDLLAKEATRQDKGSPLAARTLLPSSGNKEFFTNFKDQIVTASILGQALPLAEAKAQAQAFLDLFDGVKEFTMEQRYAAKEYHFDVTLKLNK